MSVEKLSIGLGDRAYPILIGSLTEAECIAALRTATKKTSGQMLITDGNVAAAGHAETALRVIEEALHTKVECEVLTPGESEKTFAAVEKICRKAAEKGLDRSSLLYALGGGVTGDLTGFAAAVYMRAIRFVQIPTTLLAMVDSSVGGKTGADLPEGKNLIGAFHQPVLVLIDPAFLRTLPVEEVRSGLAEVVKTAVLFDEKLFSYLEENVALLHGGAMEAFVPLIRSCCEWKASVVAEDEREKGRRALLNYGHTFGHAIEKLSGYRVSHGEGVAIGMDFAADLSCRLGLMAEEPFLRQRKLLKELRLPVEIPFPADAEGIYRAMLGDKKNVGGLLKLILPRRIGQAELLDNVDSGCVIDFLRSRL